MTKNKKILFGTILFSLFSFSSFNVSHETFAAKEDVNNFKKLHIERSEDFYEVTKHDVTKKVNANEKTFLKIDKHKEHLEKILTTFNEVDEYQKDVMLMVYIHYLNDAIDELNEIIYSEYKTINQDKIKSMDRLVDSVFKESPRIIELYESRLFNFLLADDDNAIKGYEKLKEKTQKIYRLIHSKKKIYYDMQFNNVKNKIELNKAKTNQSYIQKIEEQMLDIKPNNYFINKLNYFKLNQKVDHDNPTVYVNHRNTNFNTVKNNNDDKSYLYPFSLLEEDGLKIEIQSDENVNFLTMSIRNNDLVKKIKIEDYYIIDDDLNIKKYKEPFIQKDNEWFTINSKQLAAELNWNLFIGDSVVYLYKNDLEYLNGYFEKQ